MAEVSLNPSDAEDDEDSDGEARHLDVISSVIQVPRGAVFIESGLARASLRDLHFYVKSDDIITIRARKFPVGYKTWLVKFRELLRFPSLAALQISATAHGLFILLQDQRIKTLAHLFRQLSNQAIDDGDRDVCQMLEQKRTKFSFEKELDYPSSIKALREIEGMMGSLGSAIHINQGMTYIICLLVAFENVTNHKFNRMFGSEVKHFWDHIKDWTAVLRGRLNDGST